MWYFTTLGTVSIMMPLLWSVTYKDHLLCRSIAATATFFAAGSITAGIMHKDLQPSATIVDWTLGTRGMDLLALQAIPLFLNLLIYALVSYLISSIDLMILISF